MIPVPTVPIGTFFVRVLVWLALLLTLQTGTAQATEPHISVTVSKSGQAFVVDAQIRVEAPPAVAWDVLTDFEHMAAFLRNLRSSRVVDRQGDVLRVRQEGVASLGLFTFSFESEREIRLEPMQRILATGLSGSTQQMESQVDIFKTAEGTAIRYHAEFVPASTLARLFGEPFVRREVEEQFRDMSREMLRRTGVPHPAPERPAGH